MTGGAGFWLFALSLGGSLMLFAKLTLDDLREEDEFDDVL